MLTHNYSGYPLIRQAREMVARGDLGRIRSVHVEYAQDWLTEAAGAGNKQADWRSDPTRAGGGAIGDIGSHALHLACHVTGEAPTHLAAELSSFVPGRRVDDDAQVMLRYASGARGTLWVSQIAVGNENALRLRVYGDRGGLEWAQETPNELRFTRFGEASRILTRGGPGRRLRACAICACPGHPEGYLEAFATLYAEAAALIRAHNAGKPAPEGAQVPGIADGMLGMRFIAACQDSAAKDAGWVAL